MPPMPKLHYFDARPITRGEYGLIVGACGGRVSYDGTGWLYSLRVFLLIFRVEVCWTTKGASNG